jgi:NAD-dependent SIR2 family protein deacetylase
MTTDTMNALQAAATALQSADALLIGAGAGMGVDSGLPDFRGDAGFWTAYPPFRGRSFAEMSNPQWFTSDPTLAWGFFGHRYHLYSTTLPHAGFQRLLAWGQRLRLGYFVFTSNVDGQFQRAGFAADRIYECHGSIHYLQCVEPCHTEIWPAADLRVEVDPETIRARSALPHCPRCQRLARPNILMFGDGDWLADRAQEQRARYRAWLQRVRGHRVVAIELGAGLAIPTVRYECQNQSHTLIRVNPRDARTNSTGIGLPLGALAALDAIAAHLPSDWNDLQRKPTQ